MERLPEHSANGPSSVMSRPVDAAATLVASSGPLNGVPSDGDAGPRAMCPPCMLRPAPKSDLLKGVPIMTAKNHLVRCLALEALKLLLLSCMPDTFMMPPVYLSSLGCCRELR